MEYIVCPICEKDETMTLFVARDRLYKNPGLFRVVRCKRCKLVYTNPRPSSTEIKLYYPTNYYAYIYDHSSNSRGFWSKIRTCFYNIVLEESYGWKVRKETLLNFAAREKGMAIFRKLVNAVIKRELSYGLPFRERARVLDIGCGNGWWLNTLKERVKDWELWGIEISEKAAQYASKKFGINVFVGELHEAAFASNYFDFVTMWDTLEHIHNPIQLLKEIRRILKSDGFLFIICPSLDSLEYKLFRQHWFSLDIPRHYFNFSEKTLGTLLNKAKFDIVRVEKIRGQGYALNSLAYVKEAISVKYPKLAVSTVVLILKPICWVLDDLSQRGKIKMIARPSIKGEEKVESGANFDVV